MLKAHPLHQPPPSKTLLVKTLHATHISAGTLFISTGTCGHRRVRQLTPAIGKPSDKLPA